MYAVRAFDLIPRNVPKKSKNLEFIWENLKVSGSWWSSMTIPISCIQLASWSGIPSWSIESISSRSLRRTPSRLHRGQRVLLVKSCICCWQKKDSSSSYFTRCFLSDGWIRGSYINSYLEDCFRQQKDPVEGLPCNIFRSLGSPWALQRCHFKSSSCILGTKWSQIVSRQWR